MRLPSIFFSAATLLTLAWTGNALAQDAPSAPPLTANSNLETSNAAATWPDQWGQPKAGGSWESEEGNHFIRLASPEPGAMVLAYNSFRIPEGVKAVEVSWRQRVTGLAPGQKPWFDARIMMQFKDAEGQQVKPAPSAPYTRKDTAGWEAKKIAFIVPPGAATLEFMPTLFQVARGTFDLDDIAIVPTDPVPLQAAADAAAAAAQEKSKAALASKQAKAAAALKAEGSLIPNGGLEADAAHKGWPDGWGKPKAGGSWEAEGQNHFIRLTSDAPGKMIMLYQRYDIPADMKAMELSWKQRVSNLKKGANPWFDARIILEFLDSGGKKLSKSHPSPASTARDTDGWVERSTRFFVPEDAATLVVMPALFQVTSGTFDLDDFSLKPTDPAPLIAAAKEAERAEKARYVPPEEPNKAKWPKELHAKGNRLFDSDGKEVWLQGLNAGGLETLPNDKQVIKSAVVGVDEWKANVVRLPVKEEFWFGRNPIQKDGGKGYREEVDQIITLVANRGAYLLLDLHRFRAPTAAHVEFWKDAATRYKNHPAVLFDLFNEPHGTSWEVWRDGGFVGEKKGVDESAFLTPEEKAKNQGFESVGMQALVNAVRGVGAKNLLIVAGLAWSNDLSGITNGFALDDKGGNGIAYSWHVYNWHKDFFFNDPATTEKYPILVGEVGADTNKMGFIPAAAQEDPYTWVPDMLGFIQKHRLNWTGWCFHPRATPVMISDWNYTPTPFWGVFAKEALAGKHFEMKKTR